MGTVDLIGTMFEDDVIATSFGNYVCLPLLRKAGTNLSKEEAKKVMEDCLRVLFYRNTKSSTRVCCSAPLPSCSLACSVRSCRVLHCCSVVHGVATAAGVGD